MLDDARVTIASRCHQHPVRHIPAVFPCRDALITDVSSVARDSLHLRHGPLFVAAATTTGTGCTRAHR